MTAKQIDAINKLLNEGRILISKGENEKAIELLKTALILNYTTDKNKLISLYINIANAYYNLNDIDGYLRYYELYLKLDPKGQKSVFSRLARAYYFIDTNKAIEYHNKSLSIKVNPYDVCSKIFAMTKSSNYSQEEIKNEAEYENLRLKSECFKNIAKFNHEDKKNKKDKLNIGYLSADTYTHIMMNYILPLWKNHDTDKFNFTIFSATKKEDSTTKEIKKLNFNFIECANLTTEELAKRIYSEKIDILVDLSGFTSMLSFVHLYKPAPIIISYLGYLNTMGIKEIDYILSTKFNIPENLSNLYIEKPLYLKNNYGVFSVKNLPDIKPLPAIKNKYITFGSFNCSSKISMATICLWSEILKSTPNSKLLIYRTRLTQKIVEKINNCFKKFDIDEARLEYSTNIYTPHYLAYLKADIALDSYPFSGMSIATECALMGVPTITLYSDGLQSRGASYVNHEIGLERLVSDNAQDYINAAVKLTKDVKKLEYIRNNLRNMVLNSRLFNDYISFSRDVERCFEKVWQDFISKK